MKYREKCLSFHDEECIVCNSETDIIVHHVSGDTSNDSLLNLIPVCRSCHGKIHAGKVPFWSDKIEEINPLDMKPVVDERFDDRLTMYHPFSFRKVVAKSRGRVTLGPEYEGQPIGIAITPLEPKEA